MDSNLFEKLSQGSFLNPNKVLFFESNGQSITYQDFFSNVFKAQNLLLSQSVSNGDCVAILAHKTIGFLELYLSCVSLGAVFLPINPAYSNVEIEFFIKDAKPKLFVSCNERAEYFQTLIKTINKGKVLTLNPDESGSFYHEKLQQPSQMHCQGVHRNSIAALLYTSGTTGKPKGVQLSNQALLQNAMSLMRIWKFTSNDILLHILPLYHLHGLFVAINVLLLSIGSIQFIRKFSVDTVIEQLPHCTAMMGVPTHYTRLLDCGKLQSESFCSFRIFISGSAPLMKETHNLWKKRTGFEIVERYGMTEANIITSNPVSNKPQLGKVGVPLPGVSLRIRDQETNSLVKVKKVGSVEVKSPGLFSGYLNNSELFKQEFTQDGYFMTGDLGFLDENGYLTLEGRSKDLIISGGLNIYPKEVENIIDSIPQVKESAVIGVPHPDFGEGVVGVIVFNDNQTIDLDSIQNITKSQLATYKCPKILIREDILPRNSMLKVQKSVLREKYKSAFLNTGK